MTTELMRAAPQGACFVWPVAASIGYAQALARHLGRGDLVVISAQDGPERLRGLAVRIVMDHAAYRHIGNAVAAAWERALQLQRGRQDNIDEVALGHVRWLAQTGRHTEQPRDALTDYAVHKGWARLVPGSMGPGWFRVELTPAGAADATEDGMTRERLEALHSLAVAVRE